MRWPGVDSVFLPHPPRGLPEPWWGWQGGGSKYLFVHMLRVPLPVGPFSASPALLSIWGSPSMSPEMLMKQEKGTEVPEGDL